MDSLKLVTICTKIALILRVRMKKQTSVVSNYSFDLIKNEMVQLRFITLELFISC